MTAQELEELIAAEGAKGFTPANPMIQSQGVRMRAKTPNQPGSMGGGNTPEWLQTKSPEEAEQIRQMRHGDIRRSRQGAIDITGELLHSTRRGVEAAERAKTGATSGDQPADWWKRERGRTGEATVPDLIGDITGTTPGETAVNAALALTAAGKFKTALGLAAGGGSSAYASDAEASGPAAALKYMVKKLRPAMPRGLTPPTNIDEILRTGQAPGIRKPVFPGVYDDPKSIALEAEKNIAPESPNLVKVWGKDASREALAAANLARGPGITDPKLLVPGWVDKPKGAAAAHALMTPDNAGRMVELFQNLKTHAPRAWESGLAWYMGDPRYQRLVQLVGEEEAKRRYFRHMTFDAVESPELEPKQEIRRGANAMFQMEQGGPEDFAARYMRYGGKPPTNRQRAAYLPEMENVPGRKGQMNAAWPQLQHELTGDAGTKGPKVKPYIFAHGVPQLDYHGYPGFQDILPVSDAHFIRGVGFPDTRGYVWNKEKGLYVPNASSIATSELQTLAPWYEKIAKEVGLRPGQAQPIQWVGMANRTGVTPPYGAAKIEMLADRIMQQAHEHGEPFEKVRDEWLLNKRHLGNVDPMLAAGIAGGVGAGAASPYLINKLREP